LFVRPFVEAVEEKADMELFVQTEGGFLEEEEKDLLLNVKVAISIEEPSRLLRSLGQLEQGQVNLELQTRRWLTQQSHIDSLLVCILELLLPQD
jgi:hypothetical protein